MNLKNKVYEEYKNHINAHPDENRAGALAMKAVIEASPLNSNGVLDKTAHVPKIFSPEDIRIFEDIVGTSHRIFVKVIQHYREDEEYRKLFPFSKELEELILLPVPYDSLLPMARFDIFYNEDTGGFKFCEINTDGTAAMSRDLYIRKALELNPAHQEVASRYELKPFELFDSWVEEFLDIYGTYPNKKEAPHIAIADYLENATLADFDIFRERFENAGASCEICDIREMTYTGGTLYSPSGKAIDAIYRRAVTADVMDRFNESKALVDAVRDDAVFMAGSFATQVIHTKWLFYVLHHELTKQILDEAENAFIRAHVPLTVEFAPGFISLEEVKLHKDSYIIKPMDAYASKGIYAAGREYDKCEWDRITGELYNKGYICQEYCRQYMTDNIDFAWGDGKWHPYINMPGLYVYNGRFTGILMRAACEERIIYAHDNERTLPVFTVVGER
mgnify:CR=1 FL=1